MQFDGLIERIKAYDNICIFRHEHPDCDAVGSQFGLRQWILDNFQDKKVYALGNELCTQGSWPSNDQVDDDVMRNSLAIVTDTANQPRVDDQRYTSCKEVIKIDHHPNRDPFGSLQFVYEEAAATCEILTAFMHQNSQYVLSDLTAEYLYKGILTDTLCFKTTNTTAHTLQMAAILAEKHIQIPQINRELFDRSYAEFEIANAIRNHITVNGRLAYCILTLADQQQMHVSAKEARNYIDEMGHVIEFEIWAMLTEKVEEGRHLFDASLRSKKVQINDIAERYHGGGHRNASGVKNLTEEDVKTLLQSLFSRIEEK